MSDIPHTNGHDGPSLQQPAPLDANTRRSIRAGRTRRINARLRALDALDSEAAKVLRRITPPEGETIDNATAGTIFKGMTLRKEIQLARFRGTELEGKLELLEVTEEWEQVKRALGLA